MLAPWKKSYDQPAVAAAAAAKSLQSCPTLQPHRRQPTRLPRPWDSPGKYTGVGCHFLLQCMKVKSESEATQSCPILCDTMDCSLPGSSVHGIFPGKSTGVGCHCQHIKKQRHYFVNKGPSSQSYVFSSSHVWM